MILKEETNQELEKSTEYPHQIGDYNVQSIVVPQDQRSRNSMMYTPSFSKEEMKECELQIQATRARDFRAANNALGQSQYGCRSRMGFTLHHCYNPRMRAGSYTYTMQEVDRYVHRQSCPHLGAYRQARILGYVPNFALDNGSYTALNDYYSSNEHDKVWESSIDAQFDTLEENLDIKFPQQFRDFYKKMGFTGAASQNIEVKAKVEPLCNEYIDIAWLCPLDLDDENGLYKIYKNEKCLINSCNCENAIGNYVEYAETSSGDIFYVRVNRDLVCYEDIMFYNHETDNAINIAPNINEFLQMVGIYEFN